MERYENLLSSALFMERFHSLSLFQEIILDFYKSILRVHMAALSTANFSPAEMFDGHMEG